jgi:hypothetical protein
MQKTNYIPHQGGLFEESLGEKLATMIKEMPAGTITLVEILDIFESDGLLLLSIFLALVFLVPVSIPGVSTAFGSTILLIGISRLFNRHLRLPTRIGQRTIGSEKLTVVLNRAMVWFQRLEKICRPHRMQRLTMGSKIIHIHHIAFILAAVLLMFPFGFIPFSNTLPAIALILFAAGEIEMDGFLILLGHLANLVTIIYFFFLVAGGGFAIFEGLRSLPF